MSDGLGGVGVFLFFALSWVVPIVLVVLLFRVLFTIVEGLRSINAAVQRIAVAAEALAAQHGAEPH